MTKAVAPIPPGFHTFTPYLMVEAGNAALEFYERAFGAVVINRETTPTGRLLNAELQVGDSRLMIGEHADLPAPPAGLPRLSVYVYVPDADAVFQAALAAGAKEIFPIGDRFYGNREGGIEDPFGITWWIATHIEDVTPEEMARRMVAMGKQ